MLENQIYSIESANINQETLLAMKNASKAMKDIHGNLTIDKVDDIMYVLIPSLPLPYLLAPSYDIANAWVCMPLRFYGC